MLSRKYGFVHVCTRELVANQIAKKTEVGRVCLEQLNAGKLGNLIHNNLLIHFQQIMILFSDLSIIEWIRRIVWCKGSCLMGSQRPWTRWTWLIRWRYSPVASWCSSWMMRRLLRGLNRGRLIQWQEIYTKPTVTTAKHKKFSIDFNHSPTHIPKRSNKGIPLSNFHSHPPNRLNRWQDLLEEIE
jgi:hypothetical protein